MKIEKPKHDHKLTDLLKVCIFSLLMLAPLIASCSQWIYATINKNAYQSYSGTQTQFVQQKVNNVYRLFYEVDNDYNLQDTYQDDFNIDIQVFNLSSLDIIHADVEETFENDVDITNQGYIYIDSVGDLYLNYYACYIQNYNESPYLTYNIQNLINSFDFIDLKILNDSNNIVPNLINEGFLIDCPNNYYEMVEVQATTLDNAFYYGVDQMTKSELFNWTQNTALYSGIKAMTDNLQIQTNAIAILLTYWFILTIIYIIVDIVLKLFTTITHLGTKD